MKTVRAVALLGGGTLVIIVTAVMILIVSQVEAGLIDARTQTLLTQGEIIAMAIASQGTESDAINIDPEFPVSPERVSYERIRSTCLIVCMGSRPRASASPCPIVFTAREAVLMTPSVAFANE